MKMTAGRQLDQLIAEKIGAEPILLWNVLDPEEKTSCYAGYDDRGACVRWLADHTKDYPNSQFAGYHVGAWKKYPRYSTEIADAMLLQAEMQKRGFWLKLTSPWEPNRPNCVLWNAGFTEHGFTGWNGRPDHRGQGETAALAISLAALEALSAPPEPTA